MFASFTWRGVEYEVNGHLGYGDMGDGEGRGFNVRRCDGEKLRGATMHPGMVQLGLSRGLERAAERALEDANTREVEAARRNGERRPIGCWDPR